MFLDYELNFWCFGFICGRVVNVIFNGKFVLDGKEYLFLFMFFSFENEVLKYVIYGGVKGFYLVIYLVCYYVNYFFK